MQRPTDWPAVASTELTARVAHKLAYIHALEARLAEFEAHAAALGPRARGLAPDARRRALARLDEMTRIDAELRDRIAMLRRACAESWQELRPECERAWDALRAAAARAHDGLKPAGARPH